MTDLPKEAFDEETEALLDSLAPDENDRQALRMQVEQTNEDSDAPQEAATTEQMGSHDNSHQPTMQPISPVIETQVSHMSWYRQKKFLIPTLLVLVVLFSSTGYFLFVNKASAPVQDTTEASSELVEPKRFGIAVGLVEGTVEYSSDAFTWQALSSDTDIKEGDSIKTAEDARVVLLIDDGSAVRLDANTEVNIQSLVTDDVRIANIKGHVYTRVVASEARRFAVYADGEVYLAKGTAYRTVSTDTEKGVQVFHSNVEVTNKQATISEGNAFFTKSAVKEKEGVTSAIDLEALKNDDFIKWNAEQDKSNQLFADKLGVLVDIDKPAAKAEQPKKTTTTSSGITLKGTASDYSAVFSWTVTGVDASGGFKLVRSATSKTPTYPDNSVVYIEKGKTSYTLTDKEGGTYNYRLCAYRDGTCSNYSNSVTVTTNAKPKPEVISGTITLTLTDNKLTWTDSGKAGNGYKFVMSSTMSLPTYPEAEFKELTGDMSKKLPSDLTSGTTYHIRVCRYTNEGTCTDYSNAESYTAP